MKEDLLSQIKNNQENHFIRLIYAFTSFFLHLFENKKKASQGPITEFCFQKVLHSASSHRLGLPVALHLFCSRQLNAAPFSRVCLTPDPCSVRHLQRLSAATFTVHYSPRS